MVFREVSHGRTADAVIAQIEGLILDGVLRAGDRLPAERELARNLDVSRPILRDALADLETRGLIVTRHGGGTVVADVTGEVFREPIVGLVRNHPKAAADFLEYRREIDAVAAGFAAERATASDKERLARIMQTLEAAHREKDFRWEAELDVEFHVAISESAHNTILLHTLRACYRLLTDGVFYNRGLLYGHADSRDRLFAQHLAIHDAVIAGDPEAARAAASAHMTYVAAAVREREDEGLRESIAEMRLELTAARLDGRGRRPRRVPDLAAAPSPITGSASSAAEPTAEPEDTP
ncbi:FCD domain-containing protein [Mongoliimonas terrestris]|uniref:FCD domain-containing protein n=1 Tax=Mongoliimonas terrestris TaxID=1709001 RepID=UPI000949ABFF|nr:FCD domain-containing protein [Mongoliimonas terrestris]